MLSKDHPVAKIIPKRNGRGPAMYNPITAIIAKPKTSLESILPEP